MGKIEKIEAEVKSLTPAERAAFRAWYHAFESDGWDDEIEADAASGRLSRIAEASLAEYKRGEAKAL